MIPGPLVAAAFTAVVLAGFAWVSVDGLWRPDAFDYAQQARELARGHGFSSLQAIYALHLDFLLEHGLTADAWPNLHRFPLPPLAIAAGFRVLGEGLLAVVAYGVFFHAATSALLFAWTRSALGVAPAVAAVFLFTCNGAMLESACSGLSEPPVVFFFTLALYAWWRGRERGRAGYWLLAGAALGLATLARTNALFAAPLFGVALWVDGRRSLAGAQVRLRRGLVCGGLFSLGLFAVLTPWMLRNLEVAGTPFFSLHSFFLLPSGTGLSWEKWDLSVPWVREQTSPLEFAREHAGLVFAKWRRHMLALLLDAPTLAGTFLVFPAAFAALLLPLGARLRGLAWFALTAFVANAVLVSFTDFYFDKYSFHFLPVMILLAVAVLGWGLDRLVVGRAHALAFALFVLAMADLPGSLAAFEQVPARTARIERPHFAFLREVTGPDDVILSDQSYAVAWEAERRSVRLHYDRLGDGTSVLGALTISDEYLPIAGVYLSREYLREPGRQQVLRDTLERLPRFRRVFRNVHEFENGALYFSR